ncbi:hypothetical protein AQ490_10835 [Wenjunlia vitaminophila]|uniref:LytR/CpsA/Psr regulator C-terminal domain-containing protein n=1 Tax=Wenjunlia vitaminophila TaxID=76728 RepID=A0A0T6LK51_WENVI|nr:LCP family protein [Wenjunlia vitaminophila]KRV46405.1 hypothetical protein AQ490_10835 [Wenjunlia vitaminophila]
MNDANSPRNDAADGSGGQPHPGDTGQLPPYDPYDPYGQYQQAAYGYDPYAQGGGQQHDPNAYGYDPYAAQSQQYQQPPQHSTSPQYSQPQQYQQPQQVPQPQQAQYQQTQYPQGGYADPYVGNSPPSVDTGAVPRIPQQYPYPAQTPAHHSGQSDTGQSDTGQYDTGQYDTGQYPAHPQDEDAPRATPPDNPYDELAELRSPEPESDGGPAGQRPETGAGEYKTEQFAFVDDQEEDEEVIDWLKFAETRTERRDERRRQLRNRLVGLCLVMALVLTGGVGYLWWQDKLIFSDSSTSAGPNAGQKRDVIVLHLKELDSARSSTVLLVNNETSGKGTSVLLPNALAVSTEEAGSTTLGQSVDEEGAGPTRDALSTLLGADIKGTWRLDTPFLELLVESVGGIAVDTDTEVRGTGKEKGKVLVTKGAGQQLRGAAAVAYATYLGPGESADQQLARFGAVMQAVLKKVPSEPASATRLVESLGLVPDPSLPENELGASLAPLAAYAKTGKYRTIALTAQEDGTLDEETTKSVIKDVLGGTVRNTDPQATPRVSVRNATGDPDAAGTAKVALVNGGYTYASGGTAEEPVDTSRVEYVDQVRKEVAEEVARTLGLPKSAAKKVPGDDGDLDLTVVLGEDYSG